MSEDQAHHKAKYRDKANTKRTGEEPNTSHKSPPLHSKPLSPKFRSKENSSSNNHSSKSPRHGGVHSNKPAHRATSYSRKKFDPHVELSKRGSKTNSNLIKLNIGGVRYQTTADTLRRQGDSFFSALISGQYSATRDEFGAYFIDRDGQYFRPILEYLRTGELHIPLGISADCVQREAEYFCIQLPLTQHRQTQKRISNFANGLFIRNDHIVGMGPTNNGFEISHRSAKIEFTYKWEDPVLLIKREHRAEEIRWFIHGHLLFDASTKPLNFVQIQPLTIGGIYETDKLSLLTININDNQIPTPHSVYIRGFRLPTGSEAGDNVDVLCKNNKSTESQWLQFQVKRTRYYHCDSYELAYDGLDILPNLKTALHLEILILQESLLVRLVMWKIWHPSGVLINAWDRPNHFFYMYKRIPM
mmetsp:Transcript_13797/g.15230  ORF Transcript_13797/g.15230 Transcript_13797/m.15230 type:complete len:416 (-) Transcript_13797:39-1286(-)